MAVNFPDSPTLNQEFTSGTRTWIWNGSVWALKQTLNVSISNLQDVELNNLSNGEVLSYNSNNQKWENRSMESFHPFLIGF